MVDKVMFSSESDEWGTPQDLFDTLNAVFNFSVDAAASDTMHMVQKYFTMETDGLSQSWQRERVFVNPPYTKVQGQSQAAMWCEKAANSMAEVVALLIPARTDTKMWHELIFDKARYVVFVRGRIKFRGFGKRNSAPFPSAIAIYTTKNITPWGISKLSTLGHVVRL